MRLLRLSVLLIGLAAGAILSLSCEESTKSGLKIGAILPLTGRLSVIGDGEQKGIMMAVDSIKKWYPDSQFEVIYEDFASETKNAVTAANKLIEVDHVDAIITSTTAAAEAVSPIVDKTTIPHFVISPDVEILNRFKNNFRVYYNFRSEAIVLNRFLLDRGIKNLSILSCNYSSFQKEIEEEIRPFAEAHGIRIESIEYFDISEKDFKTVITKAKANNARGVLLFPQVNQVEALTQQLKEADIVPNDSTFLIGSFTFNWRPKQFVESLEGYYILSPKFQLNDSENAYFSAFLSRFNTPPNFDMMYAYDNVIILADLLVRNTGDFRSFAMAFDSNATYTGASGEIRFRGGRDTDVEVIMTEIDGGKQRAR